MDWKRVSRWTHQSEVGLRWLVGAAVGIFFLGSLKGQEWWGKIKHSHTQHARLCVKDADVVVVDGGEQVCLRPGRRRFRDTRQTRALRIQEERLRIFIGNPGAFDEPATTNSPKGARETSSWRVWHIYFIVYLIVPSRCN